MSAREASSGPAPPAADSGLGAAVRRLSRHTLVYALAGQLPRLISFVLVPFYTSYLDLTDYGINELLGLIITVLGYLAGINMTTAMARHYFDSADPRDRRRVVSTTLWAVALGGGLLAALTMLGAGPLGRLIDPERAGMSELVQLTLAILVLQLLREVYWRWLQTEERSTTFAVLAVTKALIELGLQIWFIAGLGWGLFGLVSAVAVSEALAVAVPLVLFGRRLGFGFDAPLFRKLLLFALPLVPNGLLQFCLHSADRMVISGLADNAQVGAYAFAYKFAQIPNFLLLTPFLMIWYPFVFSLGDEARQRHAVGRLATGIMALVSFAALGVAILAPEIAQTMAGKPEYVPAWRAIGPIVAGYWFWAAFQFAQTGFFVQKRTGRLPLLTGLAALFNIAANLYFVPRFGYMAAAVITTATFALLLAVTVRAVRPIFAVDFEWARILGPAALAAALVGFGLWLCDGVLDWAPGPATVALKVGLMGLWLLISWRTVLREPERRALLALIPGRAPRSAG